MRSYKKGLHVERGLKKLIPDNMKTWARSSSITDKMVGRIVNIYNGKQFISIKIVPQMVGRKLGEFSFTRKIYQYKKGKKK